MEFETETEEFQGVEFVAGESQRLERIGQVRLLNATSKLTCSFYICNCSEIPFSSI